MANELSVVTGAAGALGSELARVLAGAGGRVALLDRPEAGERLAEIARELGPGVALAVPIDIADLSLWAAAIERIERELGTITGAVLTAGGWQGGSPLHESRPEAFTAMIQMNLETVRCSLQALLPGMVARRAGSVVVIGSRAVERPWESANAAGYAASKAAVIALAQTVATEVLEHGVRINSVLPSTIDTPANRRAMPKADFTRWVAPSSLARVIRFLLSDDARDVSGAAIPVYGRA